MRSYRAVVVECFDVQAGARPPDNAGDAAGFSQLVSATDQTVTPEPRVREATPLVERETGGGVAHGDSHPAAIVSRIETAFRGAFVTEAALRRPFLWRAVAVAAGALLYFAADNEPAPGVAFALLATSVALAAATRGHRRAHVVFVALALIAGGFSSGVWRALRVAAPVLSRPGVGELTGFVEEVDPRREGARFILRVASAEGLPDDILPARVRLTMRSQPAFQAGDFIGLKARLTPPARAALPGGYDFARDAYFARIGAVGVTLGRIEIMSPPDPAPPALRFFAAIDRLRNELALRVYRVIGDDAGAIAAAMVAGKRDLLSEDAKNLIRRAGIFHIVTISGVQMTLVAGVFFVGLRALLALSRTLALNYPIKKWAAALAMLGAILYDLATGSRVGTERALVMTLIMLGAVIFDRPSLSMRNLALTVLFIVAFEPEALLGASFQLSFAAVAALVAVHEWRADHLAKSRRIATPAPSGRFSEAREVFLERVLHGPGATILATLCATAATASFMAADFHEISPYVLIGNPLTLAIIEFFAIPCAIIGALLYPLGLDGFVWGYLAWGIELVTWLAGLIASAPGASLHLRAFAPWALPFLALAVVSAVIWRSWTLKATALPLLAIGLAGARTGAPFDVAIAPTGDAIALREASGVLRIIGKNQRAFAAEQWLRADGDARDPAAAKGGGCDDYGCVARAVDGRLVAVIAARDAFIEDCARVAIVVTSLKAPEGCGAPIVIDRRRLDETGALTLRFVGDRIIWTAAQGPGESRPWSRSAATKTKAQPVSIDADDANAESVETADF